MIHVRPTTRYGGVGPGALSGSRNTDSFRAESSKKITVVGEGRPSARRSRQAALSRRTSRQSEHLNIFMGPVPGTVTETNSPSVAGLTLRHLAQRACMPSGKSPSMMAARAL